MSEQLLVYHGAPTLAGVKTGSLFTCNYQDEAQTYADIRRLNNKLVCKGIRILPLRLFDGKALIYI